MSYSQKDFNPVNSKKKQNNVSQMIKFNTITVVNVLELKTVDNTIPISLVK